MILLIAAFIVVVRVFYLLAEVYFERDWPRATWRGLVIAVGLFLLCADAFGQLSRVDIPLQTSGPNVPSGAGPLPQALWVSNATVNVCVHPSATLAYCQAHPITTSTDSTGATACPTSAQLTQLPSTTCTQYSGVQSNVGFWYTGGAVDYWVTSSYGSFGPYTFNPPVSNSGIAPASQINVMSLGAKGDCVTDDHNAIQAALNAQLTSVPNITVYFPAPPGGCYLTSTLTFTGASMQGQMGAGFVGETGAGVILQGMPGQDILHVPDPTTVGSVGPHAGWQIRDIVFNIDGTNDVSNTLGAHRWPGKWDQTCGINSSSNVLTCTKMEFSCADIGQAILVKGAGSGGTDLSTTVANVSPCWQNIQSSGNPTVTLAANASTTVSNAYAYLAEANMPVTQRVGNCGMAFDNYDGNSANWHMTGNTDNWAPVLWNVTFSAVNVGYNNTCAIYFGAAWNPYLSDAQNITIWNTTYGIVEGMPDTNPSSASGVGQDYQKWEHGIELTTYPWISINDGGNTWEHFQFRGAYGPQVLKYNANNEPQPTGWYVQNPELETVGFSNTMGWRVEGIGMTFVNTELCGGQSAYVETNSSRYPQSDCGGVLYMGGVNNWGDSYNGLGEAVHNYGMDNIWDGTYGTTSSSMVPTTEYTQTLQRGRQSFGTLTPDFIRNGTNPYYSDHDLFIWPEDFTDIYGYIFNVVNDSNSWTGLYAAVPVGGVGITNFNNMYMLGRGENNNLIVVGQNIPAGPVLVEFSYKCPSITTFNASVTANNATIAGPTATSCSTSYATQSIYADFTSYSGQAFGLSISAGETDIAWIGIVPVGSPTFKNVTVKNNASISNNLTVGNQITADFIQTSGFQPSSIIPNVVYSHAGTQLAACAAGTIGAVWVSDATSLTPGTAYSPSAGAGAITVMVQCTHSGSTYAWQTM